MPIFTHSVKAKKSVLVYLSKSCLPFIFFYINFVRHVTLDVHVLSQREKKCLLKKILQCKFNSAQKRRHVIFTN